ncbi:MAG: serine/threonine-protein phosphatase [Chloroflexia bacterium]|nr:serine/threonine-protein phosphatase [Chloroflexia bacterium]
MKFNISAFTHIGTKRQINQDRILVNDKILSDGFYSLDNQISCYCFVADGIGGGLAGEIASQSVLEAILKQSESFQKLNEEVIENGLYSINNELIAYSGSKSEYQGTGTTLTGIIALDDASYVTIQAGDSEMWVLRDGLFFQITESQVFDDSEQGSPLISYFGGEEAKLELSLNSSLREIRQHDLIVISSDGLLNALAPKQLKAILSNTQALKEKSEFILNQVLKTGANDNVSCILIEVVNN